jgi:hypothetical protein
LEKRKMAQPCGDRDKYIRAVKKFNSIQSFQIILPSVTLYKTITESEDDENEYEEYLIKCEEKLNQLAPLFTNVIKDLKMDLEVYEAYRSKYGKYRDAHMKKQVNDICMHVVHINQITACVKDITEPLCLFEDLKCSNCQEENERYFYEYHLEHVSRRVK